MLVRFMTILFSTDPAFIRHAVAAGVGAVIVDWEYRGKERRQAAADTQINHDTIDDLRRVRACTDALVICRINGRSEAKLGEVREPIDAEADEPLPATDEIEQAIEARADEILLPMVRTVEEVELVLDQVAGRCSVGILIETPEALELVEELARLKLSRVYVGLNDLAIERHSQNIFIPLIDRTLEQIRRPFQVPFGFGGLTLPDRGYPIPCRLLIGEMARLNCEFSFLRRSFHADIQGRDLAVEVPRIHDAVSEAFRWPPDVMAQNRSELHAAISSWSQAQRQLGPVNQTVSPSGRSMSSEPPCAI
jgi:hypothetical protein